MNSFSNILFSIGLVFLMLLKVSAFHIYEHGHENEDHEECHLCDLAMENQVAEFDFSPQIDFTENVVSTIHTSVINTYFGTITDLPYQFGLFSRPPPTTMF